MAQKGKPGTGNECFASTAKIRCRSLLCDACRYGAVLARHFTRGSAGSKTKVRWRKRGKPCFATHSGYRTLLEETLYRIRSRMPTNEVVLRKLRWFTQRTGRKRNFARSSSSTWQRKRTSVKGRDCRRKRPGGPRAANSETSPWWKRIREPRGAGPSWNNSFRISATPLRTMLHNRAFSVPGVALAGAGHRRQHGDLQLHGCDPAALAAGRRSRVAGVAELAQQEARGTAPIM